MVDSRTNKMLSAPTKSPRAERRRIRKYEREHFVYRINCRNNVVYIGITGNIKHRMELHFEGRGGRVTETHKPISIEIVSLIRGKKYAELFETEHVIRLRAQGVRAYGGGYSLADLLS